MDCFVHDGETAVAICRACGKGVCRTCAVEVTRGIACSEDCRPIAESLSQLQLASIRSIGAINANRYVQPVMAILFVALGVWLGMHSGWDVFSMFFIALGIVFGSWFLSHLRASSRGRVMPPSQRSG